jgi:mycothiol synthase
VTALTIRNYEDSDLRVLAELINAADRVDNAGFATTEEALAHGLTDPSIHASDNVFLAQSQSQLLGYVRLTVQQHEDHECVVMHGIVHPDWRRQSVGTALMKRAEQRARKLKGAKPLFLDMPIRGPVTGAAELAQSLGFRPVRCFFYMECHDMQSLAEPVIPSGILLRNYVVGQDEAAFVAAYNDGFSDHWGQAPHTLEQEMHRLTAPGFRVADNLLAVDQDGQIAGLCLLDFHEAEGGMPHNTPPLIDDLAVQHAYRRRGIGRALLLAGMHRIRDEGFSAAALAVDSENPNQALKLYESVGFVVKSRGTVYRKELV